MGLEIITCPEPRVWDIAPIEIKQKPSLGSFNESFKNLLTQLFMQTL